MRRISRTTDRETMPDLFCPKFAVIGSAPVYGAGMIIADSMVVAYLRVSTGKQNLANQQDEIRRFAAAGGIVVDRWVTEVVSGRKNEKERKLGPLLGKMRSGDTLIVTELSRLSRTLTDIMTIMGRCLEHRIVLYSIKEGYAFDDSINSKVLCFAFGLAAEIERNLISMRTKEALALCRPRA